MCSIHLELVCIKSPPKILLFLIVITHPADCGRPISVNYFKLSNNFSISLGETLSHFLFQSLFLLWRICIQILTVKVTSDSNWCNGTRFHAVNASHLIGSSAIIYLIGSQCFWFSQQRFQQIFAPSYESREFLYNLVSYDNWTEMVHWFVQQNQQILFNIWSYCKWHKYSNFIQLRQSTVFALFTKLIVIGLKHRRFPVLCQKCKMIHLQQINKTKTY